MLLHNITVYISPLPSHTIHLFPRRNKNQFPIEVSLSSVAHCKVEVHGFPRELHPITAAASEPLSRVLRSQARLDSRCHGRVLPLSCLWLEVVKKVALQPHVLHSHCAICSPSLESWQFLRPSVSLRILQNHLVSPEGGMHVTGFLGSSFMYCT